MERALELEHADPVRLPAKGRRQEAHRVRPRRGQLPCRCNADANPAAELDLAAGPESDQRRDSRICTTAAEQRALELAVGSIEDLVVPVETTAMLRNVGQDRQQDGADQSSVVASLATRVRARKDRRRRLAAQLLQCGQSVGKRCQAAGARLDVATDERPILVERALAAVVLLEGKLKLGARLDLL